MNLNRETDESEISDRKKPLDYECKVCHSNSIVAHFFKSIFTHTSCDLASFLYSHNFLTDNFKFWECLELTWVDRICENEIFIQSEILNCDDRKLRSKAETKVLQIISEFLLCALIIKMNNKINKSKFSKREDFVIRSRSNGRSLIEAFSRSFCNFFYDIFVMLWGP